MGLVRQFEILGYVYQYDVWAFHNLTGKNINEPHFLSAILYKKIFLTRMIIGNEKHMHYITMLSKKGSEEN